MFNKSKSKLTRTKNPYNFSIPNPSSKLERNVGSALSKQKSFFDKASYQEKETNIVFWEKSLVDSALDCNKNIVSFFQLKAYALDFDKFFTSLNRKGTYDYIYQDNTRCLINALTKLNEPEISVAYRLRNIVERAELLSENTREGYVLTLDHQAKKVFVVKTPKEDPSGIYHEAVVGILAINNLRKLVPNFMNTYAAVNCTKPMNGVDGINFCANADQEVPNLILENITNGVSLFKMLSKFNITDILNILLQIINALNVAYKECQFTHYDLHAENILIQTLDYEVAIPIYTNNGIKYLHTNKIARIIDYGMSHIKYQGISFGRYGLENYGIKGDEPNPMYDIHKIVAGLAYYFYKAGKDITSLELIYSSFNLSYNLPERFALYEKNKEDYFRPLSQINKSYQDILDFLLDNFVFAKLLSKIKSNAILGACDQYCVSWGSLQDYFFDPEAQPYDIIELAETWQLVKDEKMAEWLSSLDIEAYLEQDLTIMVDKLTEIQLDLSKMQDKFPDDGLLILIDIFPLYQECVLWMHKVEYLQSKYEIDTERIDPIQNDLTEIRAMLLSFKKEIPVPSPYEDSEEALQQRYINYLFNSI